MACPRFVKDSADKRIITGDFSDWLGTAEIAAAVWVIPAGIAAANESFTITTATNYITGGTSGKEYTIKVTITTNESVARLKSYSIIIAVESNCEC